MGTSALLLAMLAPAIAHAEDTGDKSAALGISLSIGTTVAGLGLIATEETPGIIGGAVLFTAGPSVGHWYAHDGLNRGQAIRAGGVALTLLGLLSWGGYGHDEDASDAVIFWSGVGVYALGTAYEIATVPRSVRTYNRRDVVVTPVARDGAAGVVLAGRF